jgi:hypothetical protein
MYRYFLIAYIFIYEISFVLIQALRKVSAKIVSNYKKDPGPAVEDYLNSMASDMNWYII